MLNDHEPDQLKLIIKIPYSEPYLYVKQGNRQTYIARLGEIEKISTFLNKSEDETKDILTSLISSRIARTKKQDVKKVLESALDLMSWM